MDHVRYAVYYAPGRGALADFGASWLGWDLARGAPVAHRPFEGLDAITEAPRRYGFHATLKPPFRLKAGCDPVTLDTALAALAADCAPARCDGLAPGRMGRFLALLPVGDPAALGRVAARCVADLDAFRAPPTESELARRRAARLSDRQEALLRRWGYPYVMEAFRFHMTLTDRLPPEAQRAWLERLAPVLAPLLPAPFSLDAVWLVGERPDGRFEMLSRHPLTGPETGA